MKSANDLKLIDLEVERWLTETPRAWLLQVGGKRVWLAKSVCEFDEDNGVVTLPQWIAIEIALL